MQTSETTSWKKSVITTSCFLYEPFLFSFRSNVNQTVSTFLTTLNAGQNRVNRFLTTFSVANHGRKSVPAGRSGQS